MYDSIYSTCGIRVGSLNSYQTQPIRPMPLCIIILLLLCAFNHEIIRLIHTQGEVNIDNPQSKIYVLFPTLSLDPVKISIVVVLLLTIKENIHMDNRNAKQELVTWVFEEK